MDYQKSSCQIGTLGTRVDFGKSCSRFWARNFVCQHRHILKLMYRLSDLISLSKIIFVVMLRRINQIGWSTLTCLSFATAYLSNRHRASLHLSYQWAKKYTHRLPYYVLQTKHIDCLIMYHKQNIGKRARCSQVFGRMERENASSTSAFD